MKSKGCTCVHDSITRCLAAIRDPRLFYAGLITLMTHQHAWTTAGDSEVNHRLLLRVLIAFSPAITGGIVIPRAAAQTSQTRDTAITRRWVTAGDAIGGFLAVIGTVAVAPLDGRTARDLQAQQLQHSDDLQHAARQLAFLGGPGPFLMGGAFFVAGRLSGIPRVADAGVHITEAVLLAASLTGLGKGIFGRALPNVNVNNPDNFQFFRGFHDRNGPFVSFPSGHTAASFAMAAVVTGEVDTWHPELTHIIGPIAYGGAALVGLARMYQNVHWASDLPLGAAIGTWSGLTVIARSHPKRARSGGQTDALYAGFIDVLRSTSVVPVGAHGAGLSWSVPMDRR